MDILAGDFDFIFKLKKLTELCFLDCQLPLAFVVKMLKELKEITFVWFKQQEKYEFLLLLNDYTQAIYLNVGSRSLRYNIIREEVLKLVNVLRRRLKADGFVCPKELQVLLRHLELEEQTHRFMMRKYVYEQRNSIGLTQEQMHLLKFLR